jgi:hypothetical protein
MYAIADPINKVIHIQFVPENQVKAMENSKIYDYGVNVAPDSIYIFDGSTNRYVGSTRWILKPNHPIDSLFYIDNK